MSTDERKKKDKKQYSYKELEELGIYMRKNEKKTDGDEPN